VQKDLFSGMVLMSFGLILICTGKTTVFLNLPFFAVPET